MPYCTIATLAKIFLWKDITTLVSLKALKQDLGKRGNGVICHDETKPLITII